MVGLAYGAPTPFFFKEREDVIVVIGGGLDIKEERRLAMIAQSGCGKKGPFYAVRLIFLQYSSWRVEGLPYELKIDREVVEIVLNFLRRR